MKWKQTNKKTVEKTKKNNFLFLKDKKLKKKFSQSYIKQKTNKQKRHKNKIRNDRGDIASDITKM